MRHLHAGLDRRGQGAARREPEPDGAGSAVLALPATCAAAPATTRSSAPMLAAAGEMRARRLPYDDRSEDVHVRRNADPIRHDGLDKVTGRANYGADFSLPGMLHGAVLRSPHAHARILSIDATRRRSAARRQGGRSPGRTSRRPSVKVAMGEGALDLRDMGDNLLAHDKVLYHGHAVAAVAATSLDDRARGRGTSSGSQYEPLQPVVSIEQAVAPGAPILHADLVTRGRKPMPAQAGRPTSRGGWSCGAATSRRGSPRPTSSSSASSAPRWCTRDTSSRMPASRGAGQDGRVVVWTTTQGPFLVRDACAGILACDAGTIKVIPSEIGGGFGGKIPVYLEPLAIVACQRKSGRPVKIVMTRDEVFRATGPTSGCTHSHEDWREAGRQARRGERLALVRGRRVSRLARRRRRHVRARLLQDSELLHRSVRRGRQQAEGRGVPRARARRWPRLRPSR